MIHYAWLLLAIPIFIVGMYCGVFIGIKICADDVGIDNAS